MTASAVNGAAVSASAASAARCPASARSSSPPPRRAAQAAALLGAGLAADGARGLEYDHVGDRHARDAEAPRTGGRRGFG